MWSPRPGSRTQAKPGYSNIGLYSMPNVTVNSSFVYTIPWSFNSFVLHKNLNSIRNRKHKWWKCQSSALPCAFQLMGLSVLPLRSVIDSMKSFTAHQWHSICREIYSNTAKNRNAAELRFLILPLGWFKWNFFALVFIFALWFQDLKMHYLLLISPRKTPSQIPVSPSVK